MDLRLPKSPFDANCGAPRRSTQLDSVLPFDPRAFLAGILSDDDVETLRHLPNEVLAKTR